MNLAQTVGSLACEIAARLGLFECTTQANVDSAGITTMAIIACALAGFASSAAARISRVP